MKLSTEQADNALINIATRANRVYPCPICGSTNTKIQQVVLELREFTGGSIVLGGGTSILPVITSVCSQCGNVQLFSANMLGVIDKAEDSKTP